MGATLFCVAHQICTSTKQQVFRKPAGKKGDSIPTQQQQHHATQKKRSKKGRRKKSEAETAVETVVEETQNVSTIDKDLEQLENQEMQTRLIELKKRWKNKMSHYVKFVALGHSSMSHPVKKRRASYMMASGESARDRRRSITLTSKVGQQESAFPLAFKVLTPQYQTYSSEVVINIDNTETLLSIKQKLIKEVGPPLIPGTDPDAAPLPELHVAVAAATPATSVDSKKKKDDTPYKGRTMPLGQVLNTIGDMWEKKIRADAVHGLEHHEQDSLPSKCTSMVLHVVCLFQFFYFPRSMTFFVNSKLCFLRDYLFILRICR